MRRADRLFQIIQILRRTSRPVTADAIAGELETSKRSVYRDIAALVGQRVPIRGEAGIGYVLERGFDLPPLMLTADELEAAVLGAQWVPGHVDPGLALAWMRSGRKMAIAYRDAEERDTERVIWPIAMGYLNSARLLVGWCELRGDFRHFRLDRVADARYLDERFPERPAVLRAKWLKTLENPAC